LSIRTENQRFLPEQILLMQKRRSKLSPIENSARAVQKRNAGLLFWLAVIVVLLLTLVPGSAGLGVRGLVRCLACDDLSGLDAVHNLLLFVPIGFLTARRLGRPWLVVAASAVLSAAIEVGQVSLIPDRDASALDVLTNTTGAAIGVGLTVLWRAGTLAWVLALLFFLGTLTGAAVLLKPASVAPALIYGQWAPQRAGFDEFHGRVSQLSLGTVAVPHGLIPDQQGFREAWARRESVRVDFQRAATSPRKPTLVARVVAVNDELVLFADSPDALIVRLRLKATEAGLRPLLLALPLPVLPASSPTTASAAFVGRDIVLEASLPGAGTRVRRVPLEPSLGWALLLPFELGLGEWIRHVSAAWVAILAIPIGFGAAVRRRGEVGLSAALLTIGPLVAGLAVVPWATASAPTHWTGWLGGTAGLLVGWGLGLRAARGRAESHSEPAPPSL
jgi:hypothetical protein